MTHADTIIARCTRNGQVNWSQVAKMTGWPIGKARSEYGHLAPTTKGEKA